AIRKGSHGKGREARSASEGAAPSWERRVPPRRKPEAQARGPVAGPLRRLNRTRSLYLSSRLTRKRRCSTTNLIRVPGLLQRFDFRGHGVVRHVGFSTGPLDTLRGRSSLATEAPQKLLWTCPVLLAAGVAWPGAWRRSPGARRLPRRGI